MYYYLFLQKKINYDALKCVLRYGSFFLLQRICSDILENDKYAAHLDEVYIAASKGFIKHIETSQAIQLLTNKMAIPQMAEYKVELCRAMTYIKGPDEILLETFITLLKNGTDWGARGGAALALGLLKLQRERIAHELADCLAQENDIGVRLRIREKLGFFPDTVIRFKFFFFPVRN